MRSLRATWAVFLKSLRLVRREPDLIAQTVILPTAILLLVASVFGAGGDRWPVALVNDSDSARATQIVTALERSRSRITDYFDLQRTDLDTARAQVEAGRLHMLVHIPEDFARSNRIRTTVFNINSDATKNVRLRLDHALNAARGTDATVTSHLDVAQPHDVWRSAYIGGSAVLLALMLGSALTAANLFVFEREHRTRTEALLTPLNPATAGAGIVACAVTVSLAASLVPLAVAWSLFELDVRTADLAMVYAAAIPILLGAAGTGILLGQLLRSYRNVQPVIVVLALVTFFGTGGFVGVAMLQPAAQDLAHIWLPSRMFTWFNPVLHGFSTGLTAGQWAGALTAGVVGALLTMYSYRRETTRSSP